MVTAPQTPVDSSKGIGIPNPEKCVLLRVTPVPAPSGLPYTHTFFFNGRTSQPSVDGEDLSAKEGNRQRKVRKRNDENTGSDTATGYVVVWIQFLYCTPNSR